MTKKVLIPLPDNDFDLTEVSVPWSYFKDNGFDITFSTENGNIAKTDPLLISGVIFGQLGAKSDAINLYRQLEKDTSFLNPIPYDDIDVNNFDALLLPGGHAKGMRQYLESTILQDKVFQFFSKKKVIGSICHGSIVLARTINPETQKSVIYERKVTGLTKQLEFIAYSLTFWKLGYYYRTYPEYVEDEVKRVIKDKNNFKHGISMWKPFVVEDDNLLCARWPLDAHLFAKRMVEKINSYIIK